MNFIKILSLFNTQPNRPRASPAIFKHVGQVPYSRGLNLGKRGRSKFWPIFSYRSGAVEFHQNFKSFQIWGIGADQKFGPFFPTGPALLNFIKILSLFNTQPNRPRASPAIFRHVGQVPYSRGFKFGEKGPIKILTHFFLHVQRC